MFVWHCNGADNYIRQVLDVVSMGGCWSMIKRWLKLLNQSLILS